MGAKRVGIIGCGSIARHHLKGYEAAGGRVVAVADVDQAAAEKLAADVSGAEVFSSHRALIESGAVDAISICTPPAFHEEAAIHALRQGIHVLCEKPFAHTLEAAQRMAAAAADSDALLMCAFRHRFLPAVLKMKELSPQIGPLVYFNNIFCGPLFHIAERWFSRREVSGGGCLIDTTSHSIDLFRFLAGEVTEQQATVHRHLEGTDVEDAAVLSVKAENGVVGSLVSTWVAGVGVAFIDLVGQKGRLYFDYMRGGEVRMALAGEADWKTIPVEASGGFAEQIGHFLGAIDGKWPLSCTARDGLRSLEILSAVYGEEAAV